MSRLAAPVHPPTNSPPLCRVAPTCLCSSHESFRTAAHAVRACHRWHERLQSSRARCLITTTSPRWQASTINDSTAHANTCICTCTRAYACVTCDFFANGHPNQWLLSPFGAHLLYGTRRTRQGLQSTERVQYGPDGGCAVAQCNHSNDSTLLDNADCCCVWVRDARITDTVRRERCDGG